MNYTLSVYADRVNAKEGYAILKGGKVIKSKISAFKGDNIKENLLHSITLGLKDCSTKVTHKDVIVMEIPNVHLWNWLMGYFECKEYADLVDKAIDVLEHIDCKYRFVFTRVPFAKKFVANNPITKMETSSLDDLMSEFE